MALDTILTPVVSAITGGGSTGVTPNPADFLPPAMPTFPQDGWRVIDHLFTIPTRCPGCGAVFPAAHVSMCPCARNPSGIG